MTYRMRTGPGTIYGMSPEEAAFETAELEFLAAGRGVDRAPDPREAEIRLGDVHLKALPYARTLELGET